MEKLMGMSDKQLREFADIVLGIPFPKRAEREALLYWIVNSTSS